VKDGNVEEFFSLVMDNHAISARFSKNSQRKGVFLCEFA
jgi:hypothetical protein